MELEMFRMLGMLQKRRSSFLVSQNDEMFFFLSPCLSSSFTYREPRSRFNKVIWVHLSDVQRSYLAAYKEAMKGTPIASGCLFFVAFLVSWKLLWFLEAITKSQYVQNACTIDTYRICLFPTRILMFCSRYLPYGIMMYPPRCGCGRSCPKSGRPLVCKAKLTGPKLSVLEPRCGNNTQWSS